MDARSASHAFFSAFRSWSRLCKSCHGVLTRGLRRSQPSHKYLPPFPRRRAYSSLPGGQTAANPNVQSSSSRNHKRHHNGSLVTAAEGRFLKFDEAIIQRYPWLDIPAFLKLLRRHVDNGDQGPLEKESSGSSALKALMRSMPHSTALITTLAAEPVVTDVSQQRPGIQLSPFYKHFRGAIVSSMTSVSLGPPAIISFNFKEPSATLSGIRANQFFTIHFLYANAHGANLAAQFLSHPGDHHAAWLGASSNHDTGVLKQVNWEENGYRTQQKPAAPFINGPGVASYIVCEILPDKCISNVSDHSIIVAKVVSGSLHNVKDPVRDPMIGDGFSPLLLYSQGQFRQHGPSLEPQPGNEQSLFTESHSSTIQGQQPIPDAGEPLLYRAATGYMDSLLHELGDSEHFEQLYAFHTLANNHEDERAKFVGALKMWQFQILSKSDNQTMDGFHIRDAASNPQSIEEILSNEPTIRDVAEELRRLARGRDGGQ